MQSDLHFIIKTKSSTESTVPADGKESRKHNAQQLTHTTLPMKNIHTQSLPVLPVLPTFDMKVFFSRKALHKSNWSVKF